MFFFLRPIEKKSGLSATTSHFEYLLKEFVSFLAFVEFCRCVCCAYRYTQYIGIVHTGPHSDISNTSDRSKIYKYYTYTVI